MLSLNLLRISSLILIFGSYSAFGLEYDPEEFADNPRCTPFVVDPTLNMTWLTSVKTWSTPLWNKQDLFKLMKISLGEVAYKKMDDSAFPDTCMYSPGFLSRDKFEVIFMNRSFKGWQPVLNPYVPGVHDWIRKKTYYDTSYVVLTDNKTFYLGASRWVDGSLGWYVSLPAGVQISTENLERIYKKIESLGFSRKSAYFLKKDCPEL